jgi:TRAP-type C4-dicarboxylate transport system permease small subunit
MAAIYKGWLFFQEHIIGRLAALVMLAATIFAVSEVFGRYVVGHSFQWGQDAVTYSVISATFLYFGATQAKRAHLAVTALPDWLRSGNKEKAAFGIRAFALFCVVVFVICFIYWGAPGAMRTWRVGTTTESLAFPLWPFQWSLLIGMGMMGITALFQLYREIMRMFGRDVFPWEPDDDQLVL